MQARRSCEGAIVDMDHGSGGKHVGPAACTAVTSPLINPVVGDEHMSALGTLFGITEDVEDAMTSLDSGELSLDLLSEPLDTAQPCFASEYAASQRLPQLFTQVPPAYGHEAWDHPIMSEGDPAVVGSGAAYASCLCPFLEPCLPFFSEALPEGMAATLPWSATPEAALLAGVALPERETLKQRHSESSSLAESLAYHPHLGTEGITGPYRTHSGAQSSAAAAFDSPPGSWAAEACAMVKAEQAAAWQCEEAPAATPELRKRAADEGCASAQRKRPQPLQHARRGCGGRATPRPPSGEDRARNIQRAYLDRKKVGCLCSSPLTPSGMHAPSPTTRFSMGQPAGLLHHATAFTPALHVTQSGQAPAAAPC